MKDFDVIIIGGSYAGLSAAMSLGRSMRNVLVVDNGQPCNKQTPHSHNFLTRDGEEPAVISRIGREQVAQYPTVRFADVLAVGAAKRDDGFEVQVASGDTYISRKLILAMGIRDLLPGIKGLAECWGIGVVHCPYCHGYEFRGVRTAIIANGDKAVHLASLVSNLTKRLSILTNGPANFSVEQLLKLNRNGITVREEVVSEIIHNKGNVSGIVFQDQSKAGFDAIYAAVPFEQQSGIPAELGCKLTEMGHITVDAFQKTTVAGIFACGDNSTMMRSVAAAVASGNMAGAMANAELTGEQF